MRRLRWILGTVLVIGIGGALLPDDAVDQEPAAAETVEAAPTVEPEETEPDQTDSDEAEPDEIVEVEPDTASPTAEPEADEIVVDGETAIDVLETLEVKGRAPKTGYSREEFGQRWADVDRNGCDTRNDILRRDLTDTVLKPGTHDCVVLSGTLVSPFTAEVISFTRGQDTSSEVHIDHVVALSDAWQKGAQQLSPHDRELFANDPLNLLAVDGRSNSQKGDGDAATWLPANKAFRCDYVARQVSVKAKYDLWVTPAEKEAVIRVLDSCPGQLVPEPTGIAPDLSGFEPTPQTSATTAPPETVEPTPVPTENPAVVDVEDEVYYENCDAARAAGAAPLLRGEPGYRERMDGDKDGIACE